MLVFKPENIESFEKLSILYLKDSHTITLPDGISKLLHLKEIKLSSYASIANIVEIFQYYHKDISILIGEYPLYSFQDSHNSNDLLISIALRGNALYNVHNFKELFQLKNLKKLCISNNIVLDSEIDFLFDYIFKINQLEKLELIKMGLKDFKIPVHDYLNTIKHIDLSGNKFREIPENIKYFRSLETLKMSDNKIKNIDLFILELENIKKIDLENNEIENLPIGLEKLKNLNFMNLKGNLINEEEQDKIRKALPNCKILFIDMHEYFSKYAKIYAKQYNFQKQYEYQKKAVELEPANFNYWCYLGAAALHNIYIKEAFYALNKAKELYPQGESIESYLAIAHLLNDEYNKAENIVIKWKDKVFLDIPNQNAREVMLTDVNCFWIDSKKNSFDKIKHIIEQVDDNKKTEIKVVKGNIETLSVEAVVTSASPNLLGSQRLEGLLHEKGGRKVTQECYNLFKNNNKIGFKLGEAVITTGGNLKFKIIHTIAPLSINENKLKESYWNSLLVATENNIKSIAFPNLSTGGGGFPNHLAAPIAINTIREFIKDYPNVFTTIIFACYSDENHKLYKSILEDVEDL